MHGTFTLKIRLGNDAMSEAEDVAASLRKVAEKVEYGVAVGQIMDVNGNDVGTFELSEDAP